MGIIWRTITGVLGSIGHSNLKNWASNIFDVVCEQLGIRSVADFNFVTSRIATGAALSSAADVQQIIAAGITAVIDARDDFNDGPLFAGTPGIRYLWNPTPDDGTPKPPAYWQRALEFALPLLAQPHNKILLHCSAGINRGPSTAYCIMVALSFDPVLAESLIRKARPIVGLAYADDAFAACRALGYV